MAKGQQRSDKEAKKPEKAVPSKPPAGSVTGIVSQPESLQSANY